MSVFWTKIYMQPLRSLFWVLLTTILSIISLAAFPLIRVDSQTGAAPPSYKLLTSKCNFYEKPVHYLTLTKIKCIWAKYIYTEEILITKSSGIYEINIYHKDCYLRVLMRGSTLFIYNLGNQETFS